MSETRPQGFADHFALFDLPRGYAIELPLLEQRYRDVQSRVHPDKFAHLSETEKRVAMQWATQANEAFQTLKNPIRRGLYLLALAGHDPQVESNTAMPMDFLMEQMELREAVADARSAGDEAALEDAHDQLRRRIRDELGALEHLLDDAKDYQTAGQQLRKLMFLDKLRQDVDAALEAVGA